MKRPYIPFTTLSLLVIIAMTVTGCGADKNLKKGEKYLAIGEYYDAATQFKQAYSRTSPKERERRGQIALKIAYCNERINASQKAMAAYSNAIRYKQASTMDRLAYARQLLRNGSYKQAETMFKEVVDSLSAGADLQTEKKTLGRSSAGTQRSGFGAERTDMEEGRFALYGQAHGHIQFAPSRLLAGTCR